MVMSTFFQILGVVLAASWGSFAAESVAGIHPVVRRGVQIGLCTGAGIFIGRLFGAI